MAGSTHSSSSLSELPSESSNKTSSSITSERSAGETLAKDVGFSPTDVECQIQADRITKSLDKAVYLTKLALCLPVLTQSNALAKILTHEHFNDFCYVFDQHLHPFSPHTQLNMAAVEDMQAGDISLKNRINPEFGCMLHILDQYEALKPYVEDLTEKAKNPPAGLTHLLKLEEFRDLMVVRMKTSAAAEISAIIRTRRLEKSNSENVAKISEYAKSLKEEKEYMEEQMQDKMKLIAQLKEQIVVSTDQDQIKRKKQILDSERQMVLAKRAHVVKYQMLKEEEIESKVVYENSLDQNLRIEKQLRDRRRKVETQLQAWLLKYDMEMSIKQVELEDVTEQYEDENNKVQELKCQLEEQNIEYEKLMAEREEEYHQEMTTKMNEFIVEHAVRVIQIAWRQTQSNRAEKSKLLKLKKKQEAERAEAARKAELEAKKQALEEKKRAAREKRETKAAAKAAKSAKQTGQTPEGVKGDERQTEKR